MIYSNQLYTTSKNKASVVSHYYVDPLIQEITEKTGGFVGDSLEMAKFGSRCESENLIVCGVKFMAETAKILSPEKYFCTHTRINMFTGFRMSCC